ncbi:MAG: 4Fe-4S ferredoxin [Deltaproteobacteria bacterium]|nr:MAG: 4Fe-4S ferredoxin [Deltaproteobacteria bacterium]
MSNSKVYFCDMKASAKENLLDKLKRLMDRAGFDEILKKNKKALVAVKLHFGEKGNSAFIRPIYIKRIVDYITSFECNPFLTDANTLYAGTRSDSVSHIRTAIENGFAYAVVNAPIIIADGLRGGVHYEIDIDGDFIKKAYIAREIIDADVFLSVAHFKGHELSGFGGAIKNTGMGCASRKGKLDQHSDLKPKVKRRKCKACGECVKHCAQGAISIDKKSKIDPEKCVGCCECILICPYGAIEVQWDMDAVKFQKKMAEYTKAVLKSKEGRAFFINFLTTISPACDCYGHNDAPIVPDIGILASTDPVAIDQACVDLVNKQPIAPASVLARKKIETKDKFRAIYPQVDWKIQLEHAEKMGLGTRQYKLIRI